MHDSDSSSFSHQRTLHFQPRKDLDLAVSVVERLKSKGWIAWFAGGCVRDGVLGREPKDYDVATNAPPEEVEKAFSKTVAVGKAFGVIRVIGEGCETEVASFRRDGLYVDGRRPESIEFSSPQEDSARRDFTINSLFYDPIQCVVYDFQNGLQDLQLKKIKAIGDAKARFEEDHLRILRGLRFAAELGFQIDPETREAMKNLAPKISMVSTERRRDEILKFFKAPQRRDCIPEFVELGFDEAAVGLRGLLPSKWRSWSLFFPNWPHSVDLAAWAEIIRWGWRSQLISDLIGVEKFLKDMKCSRQEIQALSSLYRPFFNFQSIIKESFAESRLALYCYEPLGYEALSIKLFLKSDESRDLILRAQQIYQELGPQKPEPLVRASDLPDLKGKSLGEALELALLVQVSGKGLNKKEIIDRVRDSIGKS